MPGEKYQLGLLGRRRNYDSYKTESSHVRQPQLNVGVGLCWCHLYTSLLQQWTRTGLIHTTTTIPPSPPTPAPTIIIFPKSRKNNFSKTITILCREVKSLYFLIIPCRSPGRVEGGVGKRERGGRGERWVLVGDKDQSLQCSHALSVLTRDCSPPHHTTPRLKYHKNCMNLPPSPLCLLLSGVIQTRFQNVPLFSSVLSSGYDSAASPRQPLHWRGGD